MLCVERGRAVEWNELARAASSMRLGTRILVLVLELDAGTVCKELERGREVQALLELDETERVPAGITAEALEQLLAGRDRERWRALVVQRAEASHPVVAGPPQFGVAAGELDEVRCITHALLGFLGEAAQSAPLQTGQHRLWLLRRICEGAVLRGAALRSFVRQIVQPLADRVAATARGDRTIVRSIRGHRVGHVRLVDACAFGEVGADVGDGHSPPLVG